MTMIGQILNDRYEILEKAGEGGMAVTYRGRDRLLGRAVAIKVLRPELAADAEFVSRFRREARAAAGITHEHIAGIYDTGSHATHHYIVMEFVEGESLKDRLRREGPLPLAEALRIAEETAEALEAAHSMGVVHRDIKPHNVLLGKQGSVKVTDFGIARAMSSPAQTETGTIVGSVHYISPEQARGEAVGPQADIYSVGATLFEMLTGKPPFDGGDRFAILHMHIYDRPPRIGDIRPGVPVEVDSVVDHCLEKDLSRRFASIRELLGYLAVCPRDEEQGWRSQWGRGAWRRRLARNVGGMAGWLGRRAIWAVMGVIILAAILAGVTLWASAQGRAAMVRVPDVVGMKATAAREYLATAGLDYREVGSKPSDEIDAGAVIGQDPPANLQTRPGAIIKVVLSDGPSHVVVPNVTQMSVTQAQRNLEAAGLAIGQTQTAYDPRVPANYVASTLPGTGARVVRGTVIDLVVSLGPAGELPSAAALPPQADSDEGRTESLSYIVPTEGVPNRELVVTVQVLDEQGERTIYEGRHRPGESIPKQTITVTSPTTARIFVAGRLRAERQYLP